MTACDVMVDSLHWSGGNTSLDALSTGLPVVTHPGPFMRSRQSTAMLRRMGLAELIASSPDDLAHMAVSLARSPDRLRTMRTRVETALPQLFATDGLSESLHEHVEHLLQG